MNDIALDPLTHDLAISGLDLAVIKGADRVRQNLLIKLRLWTGEWFLDTEFGTPYLESILGKDLSLNGALAALKTSILEVADVSDITAFTHAFDRSARKLTVNFEVATPFGLIRMTA